MDGFFRPLPLVRYATQLKANGHTFLKELRVSEGTPAEALASMKRCLEGLHYGLDAFLYTALNAEHLTPEATWAIENADAQVLFASAAPLSTEALLAAVRAIRPLPSGTKLSLVVFDRLLSAPARKLALASTLDGLTNLVYGWFEDVKERELAVEVLLPPDFGDEDE